MLKLSRSAVVANAGLGLILTLPATAQARWEKVAEAGAVDIDKMTITVNKDGTSSASYDHTVEVKLDAARTSFGTASFWYNAAASRLISVQAETINGSKVTKVDKDHIEVKPEHGQDLGFDKTNHVSIAFPEVAVGSKLHYVYTLETDMVPIAGLYDQAIAFGSDTPDMPGSRITYRSAVPLQVVNDDPSGYLKVSHQKEGNTDVVDVQVVRPVYFKVVSESSGGYFVKPPNPMVFVSTFKDWGSMGKVLAAPYDAELKHEIPPKFAKIIAAARTAHPDFVGRVNDFTAALVDLVRYQGDWRTVRGGHVPRHLETIAESGYGDCKDMALVTAVALRAMGYKANIALIARSESLPFAQPLPTVSAFNHAIVRAEDEHGVVHWVDATNRVSRTQGIRADIAGRSALIIDGDRSRLEKTPALTPTDYVFGNHSELTIRPEIAEVSAHHRLHFGGGMAEGVTGWELGATKDEIDETLLREISDSNQVFTHTIAPYDLRSRVVRDVDFDITLRAKIVLTETTAGHAFPIAAGHAALAKLDLEQRVSGVALGKPETTESTQVLENTRLIGSVPKACAFSSQWLNGERRIQAVDGKIVIAHRYTGRRYGITVEELKTPAFAQFQRDLKSCFGAYSVVFSTGSENRAGNVLSH